MVNGETGAIVASVLGVMEEENNISPGTVTLLLQPMGGNTAEANILSIFLATPDPVIVSTRSP